MKTGVQLIEEERNEQLEHHKFGLEQDQQYRDGDLADAAVTYIIYGRKGITEEDLADIYPWNELTFKPKDRIKNLQKAGALIAAEIDRLQVEKHKK